MHQSRRIRITFVTSSARASKAEAKLSLQGRSESHLCPLPHLLSQCSSIGHMRHLFAALHRHAAEWKDEDEVASWGVCTTVKSDSRATRISPKEVIDAQGIDGRAFLGAFFEPSISLAASCPAVAILIAVGAADALFLAL